MKCLNFTTRACYIGATVILALLIASPGPAQEEPTTLSGTVINTDQKPIPNFTLGMLPTFLNSKTDENGAFAFSGFTAKRVQMFVYPWTSSENDELPTLLPEPNSEIISIQIGNVKIYQDSQDPFGGIFFGVKPGSRIENIVVTVQQRSWIRTRVLFKDGKPLRNTHVSWKIQLQGIEHGQRTRDSGSTTDPKGYFIEYVDSDWVPAHCTISVNYNGISAESEEVLLEKGKHVDIVVNLDAEAPAPNPKPKRKTPPQESLPSLLRKLTGTPTPTDTPTGQAPATIQQTPPGSPRATTQKPPEGRPAQPAARPQRQRKNGAWVVNPENGHAYKKIRCTNPDKARNQAIAENAYLVTINSEAEQNWLLGCFGNQQLYWIGLSDAENEGDWVWHNGDPLLYTNWGAKGTAPRSALSPEQKDNAVMSFLNGKWQAVGPGDLLWQYTRVAILEKDD